MAEIHVQRKHKSMWWLWLLIILIIVAIICYYVYQRYYDPDGAYTMIINPYLTTT